MELQLLLLVFWLPVHITLSPQNSYQRCRCINSTTKFHPKQFEKIEVTLPTSFCNYTEIIVTVRSTRQCLNPKTELGKIIISCLEENGSNSKVEKKCVKKKWRQLQNKTKNKMRKKRKSKNKHKKKQQ
ncbi:growth-regulated alpha protein-like [Hyla sarda]|uniref:growth-regulated alpha protein-like n=1 Tax=Hyla sarda TaxID=327740 RepID=UPI0024C221FE|nr:growth-regulated alpha protein-like [Hyla sarda]